MTRRKCKRMEMVGRKPILDISVTMEEYHRCHVVNH